VNQVSISGPVLHAIATSAVICSLFCALPFNLAWATAEPNRQPLRFNVWLDERKMGAHTYTFDTPDPASDTLVVTSQADFKVKVVFVTVFSYQHKAIETWRGNCLSAVQSTTTTNGKQEAIQLELATSDCAGTYAYWDKQRLHRAILTNAQTGAMEAATWTELGTKKLPTIGKRKKIHGYSDDAQLVSVTTPSAQFMLYYSNTAELLMMQTENDSRTITYLHESLTAR